MNKEQKLFIDKVITSNLMQYITSILLGYKDHTPYNGSIALVDTGERQFGITANHIFKEYDKHGKDKDFFMQIARYVIDPNDRIIDRNEELDLATINLEGVQTAEISLGGANIGTTFFKAPIWPPKPPTAKERITICGFPSKLKFKDGDKWNYVTCTIGAQEIHGVSEDSFTIQFERDKWYYTGGEVDSRVPQEIGGVSGGAMFRLNNLENKTQLFSYELLGINKEHHPGWDILYGARLDCIDKSGNIVQQYR